MREKVLDEEGHTPEGPFRKICDGGVGPIVQLVDHRIDTGVERLDSGDRGGDQILRLDLAVANQFGKSNSVVVDVLISSHGCLRLSNLPRGDS